MTFFMPHGLQQENVNKAKSWGNIIQLIKDPTIKSMILCAISDALQMEAYIDTELNKIIVYLELVCYVFVLFVMNIMICYL